MKGHKVEECNNRSSCIICEETGERYDHRIGTKVCLAKNLTRKKKFSPTDKIRKTSNKSSNRVGCSKDQLDHTATEADDAPNKGMDID